MLITEFSPNFDHIYKLNIFINIIIIHMFVYTRHIYIRIHLLELHRILIYSVTFRRRKVPKRAPK